MGGKAFSSEGLYMPRMPPSVYHKILVQVQSQLREIYSEVRTPIEGPAKVDYGDIDVLVLLGEGKSEPGPESVMKALGAEHHCRIKNCLTTHYALPWPYDESACSDGGEQATCTKESIPNQSDTKTTPRFIQIDVHLCSDVAELQYTEFRNSHGDFWNILGVIIRPFGLLNTHSGFYYHITDIEPLSKNDARIKLTDEPHKVMEYLGIDPARFWGSFNSWDEMIDYAGTCRFHDPGYGKQYDNERIADKPTVNAHDRSKSKQRPMLRYWLTSYLPAHRDDKVGSAAKMTPDEVVEDLKSFFGKEVANEIDEKRASGVRAVAIQQLWSDIRKTLPCSGSDLTYTLKGLKFEVADSTFDESLYEIGLIRAAFTNGQYDEVKKWACMNWEDVKDRQIQRDRAKSTAKLLEHVGKQKALAAEEVAKRDGND